MMFLDLVSELEKKHDTFDKHCYDNRQVYSLESIADLQQAQQPKSDVVYFTYDLSTLHNRKLPRNLIFCGESSFISEQLIPNTIQMPEKEMSIFLKDAEELLHSNYKLQDIYIQMLNAVMSGKGIGAMLENVGNALNTSIAIIDMSGKVISNSIPFQVDEPVWQESIKNGYCPPLFIEHIKDVKSQHGEEGGNGPFLRHCIDNHLFYLSNRIILQGELYGYIFMIQVIPKKFTPSSQHCVSAPGLQRSTFCSLEFCLLAALVSQNSIKKHNRMNSTIANKCARHGYRAIFSEESIVNSQASA